MSRVQKARRQIRSSAKTRAHDSIIVIIAVVAVAVAVVTNEEQLIFSYNLIYYDFK